MKVIVRVLGEAEAPWGGRAQPGSQGPSHHTIQTTGQARGYLGSPSPGHLHRDGDRSGLSWCVNPKVVLEQWGPWQETKILQHHWGRD